MHVEHPYAETCCSFACACDRIRNVVKFEIEKHVKAARDYIAYGFRTVDREQLAADLDGTSTRIQLLDQRERGRCAVEIERNNYPRINGYGRHYPSSNGAGPDRSRIAVRRLGPARRVGLPFLAAGTAP